MSSANPTALLITLGIWHLPAFQPLPHLCITDQHLANVDTVVTSLVFQNLISPHQHSPQWEGKCSVCLRNSYRWSLMPLGDQCGDSSGQGRNWETTALKSPLGQGNSPEDDIAYFQQLCHALLFHSVEKWSSESQLNSFFMVLWSSD